jgi:ligand-binding sensor domain-containing protein/signal transduction histidine kinase
MTQYIRDIWGVDAGLPHNSVDAIAQTPDGYLWLGTEEGLARFDGVHFKVFDKENTPALASNHISSLLVDSRKRLWIGTQGGGLVKLENGTFATYSVRNGLPNDIIQSLYEDRQGALWIGTDGGGVVRLSEGTFTRYTSSNGLPSDSVFSLAGDNDGTLWIGTHAGLAQLKGRKITTYTTKDGLSDNYVKCLFVSPRGDVWIGTNEGGLSHLLNGHFISYDARDGLGSSTIWSVYEDKAGTLWIGTFDSGLNRFRNGRFSTYTAKDGLPANRVFALFEDREGDLWVGTGGGLVRLKSGSFTALTSTEGLSNDVVLPVFEDHKGAIWVGTNGHGLNRIQDGHVTTYTTQNGLSDNTVFSIAEDKDGSLWVATHNGLNQLKNGRFRRFSARDGLLDNIILCLYRDREGSLWAGGRTGLSRYDGVRFNTYSTRDGLSSNYVSSLYEDQQNTLWIGTAGGGLNRLKDGHFSSYTTKGGLSSNIIWALNGDADGTLWIGTSGGGLNRYKDGKFTAYTTRQGLFDDEVFEILPDRHGNLWMSSNKGVFRVPIQELNDYAEGHRGSIISTAYGTSDGLKDKECNGGFQPAGWQTRDGRLLFPTMKGLAIVDPGKLNTNHIPPPVLIERVTVDGSSFDPGTSITAKPGKGQLEFEFTAPSLVASDKIRFKYKLDGFDREWIDAGERREAYYTNIPPGQYRFTVIACNNDGVWNTRGASQPLELSPHFYQTWLFLAACAGLLGGLSLGIYCYRINRLKANERRLVHLVDERTHALKEQIDAKETALADLAKAQQNLLELSRRSGMAEVATGVLHNVGNVLNSLNITASVIGTKLCESRLDKLSAAVNMLKEHDRDIANFLETDPKGQRVIPYLARLAAFLQTERVEVLAELESLTAHVDHIKKIVATQQDYAKVSALIEAVSVPRLVDDALKMVGASFDRHRIEVIREIDDVPEVAAAKHQVLEILVNLLRNAKQAVVEHNGPERQVRICVRRSGQDQIRIEVHDTGTGLPPENLTRIFAHGFTTKRNGHGFGLHSGALAARQMQGSLWAESEGPGLGATFILELPANAATPVPEMAAV